MSNKSVSEISYETFEFYFHYAVETDKKKEFGFLVVETNEQKLLLVKIFVCKARV